MPNKKRKSISLALSGDTKLINQLSKALEEVLAKFDLSGNSKLADISTGWSQTGGWYLDLSGPQWSQSGGWVLDTQGQLSMRVNVPKEKLVRDVWAAFNNAKNDDSWGPLPLPEAGPLAKSGPVK